MSERREFVLKAPIVSVIWSLAWPLVLSNQLQTCTSAIALFWFGRLLGETGLVVDSLFRPFALIVSWLLGATTVGASVLVSRSVGADDGKGLSITAGSITLTLSMCAVLMVIIGPISPWLADLLSGNLGVDRAMLHYIFGWLLVATPAYCVAELLLDIVTSTGATRFSLVRVLVDLAFMAAIVPILMKVVGLGIAGGPISEGLAALALIPMLWIALVRRRKEFAMGELLPGAWRVHWAMWKEIIVIGLPPQLGRIAYFVSQLIMLRLVIKDGKAAVAGYGIALQLLVFGAMTTLALAGAGAILIGQSLGAKMHDRAKRGLRLTLIAGAAIMGLFVVVTMFDRPIIGIFTSDTEIIDATAHALSIVRWAGFGVATWQILMSAFGAHRKTVRASILLVGGEAVGLTIGLLWPGTGLDAGCVAVVAANAFKGAALLWLLARGALDAGEQSGD